MLCYFRDNTSSSGGIFLNDAVHAGPEGMVGGEEPGDRRSRWIPKRTP